MEDFEASNDIFTGAKFFWNQVYKAMITELAP